MKKIFLCFTYFFLIFSLQLYLFLNDALKIEYIPFFTEIKEKIISNSPLHEFMIFSGTNTGYGFYGVNVATNKYYFVELYDVNNVFIKKIEINNFKTSNAFSRFDTSTSWIYNFNVDTKEYEKNNEDSKQKEKYCKIRNDYETKIYKYIGQFYAKKEKNCKFYKVKLATIVPPNIWKSKLTQNNLYVIQEKSFKIKN